MTTKTRTRDLAKLWEDIRSNKKKPPKNENIWLDNPYAAFIYAKYVRKSRWSESQEVCFYNNIKALYSYSFWITNSLGQSVPDHLHNFMLAKSLEDGKDEWVSLYFKNIKK